MKLATPEEIEKRLAGFNAEKAKIKRDRPYIPLTIPEGTDTTSPDWQMYCLALHTLNLPSEKERKASVSRLKEKSPEIYKLVMPHMNLLKREHWGSDNLVFFNEG